MSYYGHKSLFEPHLPVWTRRNPGATLSQPQPMYARAVTDAIIRRDRTRRSRRTTWIIARPPLEFGGQREQRLGAVDSKGDGRQGMGQRQPKTNV